MRDPVKSERHLRFVVMGAGMAGILSAIRLKQAGYADFAVYEKADRPGGTWRENTYPGLTCDIPSHAYTYSFAPNPDWSRHLPPGPEIYAYAGNDPVNKVDPTGEDALSSDALAYLGSLASEPTIGGLPQSIWNATFGPGGALQYLDAFAVIPISFGTESGPGPGGLFGDSSYTMAGFDPSANGGWGGFVNASGGLIGGGSGPGTVAVVDTTPEGNPVSNDPTGSPDTTPATPGPSDTTGGSNTTTPPAAAVGTVVTVTDTEITVTAAARAVATTIITTAENVLPAILPFLALSGDTPNIQQAKNIASSAPKDKPPGTKPIDQSGLGKDDIHSIKGQIGAAPTDWVGVTPGGHVITTDPVSGNSVDHGPASDYVH